MKASAKFILGVVGIAIVIYFIYSWSSAPGKYDEFAQCLTEKGTVMYGTDWCHYCQAQKKLFGRSFEFIDYKNCDFNKIACDEAGVEGYPTWEINNTNYAGVQPLDKLAGLTGCDM